MRTSKEKVRPDMADVSKDIERLIFLSLDHALSEDQQLMLDRELIRNPAAHQLMEAYRRIDARAAEALRSAVATDRLPLEPDDLPPRRAVEGRGRFHRAWWLLPGAIAAALSAFFLARESTTPTGSGTKIVRQTGDVQPLITHRRDPFETRRNDLMRNVGTVPRIKRDTGREVIGVVGDNGDIYWLEVDRTYTIRLPAKPRTKPPGGM